MNTETKRHIDSARQVLVGVVPNPTSQIDQITNALIYKFMDDMDQAAIKVGGDPNFFTGDLEKYAWTRLMNPRLGNQERMNLYAEALLKFSESKQLPELFRGIFKSAFLPYRSPETLGMFLKEINYFDYSHPEELGNAYEYLLSIMSSQGDAGQFRTPRHIIDFIVEVVNPTKDDKILDPACGTAGFLISAYKHILAQHDGKDDPEKKEKQLTPDQRKNLFNNFEGYDIDPGMVRIAEVNMYLHQFKNPKIFQYDSLSMEERWNDKFDVIMANPPFMSPKGGIKPHSKFSIQSNRSEVLFVDYIMNHLRPNGRAGIIVPEGIIFQSGIAYKQLRKKLIEDGLYSVVSLPSGVFNPYSGVKTSILLFDNEISKKSEHVLFIKIQNDGFDLGAQRRLVAGSDLPLALEVLLKYKKHYDSNGTTSITGWPEGEHQIDTYPNCFFVSKKEISKSGDYNLSGDRYRGNKDYTNAKWPMVKLEEIIHLDFGERITKNKEKGTKFPVYGGGGESFRTDRFNRESEYVVARFAMSENCVRFVKGQFWMMDSGGTFSIKEKYQGKIDKDFIGNILLNKQEDIFLCARGGAQKNLNHEQFYEIEIPLPPIEVQKQIVEELTGYQNIINGAKLISNNWKPKINIDPKWEKVKLGDICDVRDGTHDSPKQMENGYPLITSKNIKNGNLDFSNVSYISEADFNKVSQRSYVDVGDIIMPMIGTIGGACLIKSKEKDFAIKNVALFKKSTKILPEYLLFVLGSELIKTIFKNQAVGATQKFVSLGVLRELEIPLPPVEIQKQIVKEIEFEHGLVDYAKKLIEINENKTKEVITKLWEQQ